jgi:hypothetical protein
MEYLLDALSDSIVSVNAAFARQLSRRSVPGGVRYTSKAPAAAADVISASQAAVAINSLG